MAVVDRSRPATESCQKYTHFTVQKEAYACLVRFTSAYREGEDDDPKVRGAQSQEYLVFYLEFVEEIFDNKETLGSYICQVEKVP